MSTAPTESDRAPAPGPLGLVQKFVNTLDAEEGRDLLANRETFSAWLQEQGLAAAGPPPGERDIAQARELREALRALCTVGEICETLRAEWGMYDAVRSRP